MTYEEILKELEEVNLKEKFTSIYENICSDELLKMIKETNSLNSTATMIRCLLKHFKNESEDWLYWQKVLFYFMTPIFQRNLNF